MTSALYQSHTHYVVYKLHLHNSSIVSHTGEHVQYAALAYSAQPPPPTVEEIEGGRTGRKGILKLQNNFQYRHSPDRIDKIDKKIHYAQIQPVVLPDFRK